MSRSNSVLTRRRLGVAAAAIVASLVSSHSSQGAGKSVTLMLGLDAREAAGRRLARLEAEVLAKIQSLSDGIDITEDRFGVSVVIDLPSTHVFERQLEARPIELASARMTQRDAGLVTVELNPDILSDAVARHAVLAMVGEEVFALRRPPPGMTVRGDGKGVSVTFQDGPQAKVARRSLIQQHVDFAFDILETSEQSLRIELSDQSRQTLSEAEIAGLIDNLPEVITTALSNLGGMEFRTTEGGFSVFLPQAEDGRRLYETLLRGLNGRTSSITWSLNLVYRFDLTREDEDGARALAETLRKMARPPVRTEIAANAVRLYPASDPMVAEARQHVLERAFASRSDVALTATGAHDVFLKPTLPVEADISALEAPLRERLIHLGIHGVVETVGTDKLRVRLDTVSDARRLKQDLALAASFGIYLVDEPASNGRGRPGRRSRKLLDKHGAPLWIIDPPFLTSADLIAANPGMDEVSGMATVNFRLTEPAGKVMATMSAGHLGERFAIVLDGHVLSAPVIQGVIYGGVGRISGDFSPAEARDLAALLGVGHAALPLKVLSERPGG